MPDRALRRRWRGRRRCSRDSLPYWPVNPSITPNAWFQFQLDLVRCLYRGAAGRDPLGRELSAGARLGRVEGRATRRRLVGGVYAANTLGAIVGSLTASLLLIVLARHAALAAGADPGRRAVRSHAARGSEAADRATFAVAGAIAGLLALSVHPIPGIFVAYGRYTATQLGQADVIYVGEGWNASVAVSERSNGVLNYHNAGKVQASSEPQDMRLQRMLGHLTTLVPKKRRRGRRDRLRRGRDGRRGVGRSGRRARDDRRDRAARAARGLHLLRRAQLRRRRNPKVHVHIDDARHFLLTTKEKFDAITSDPLDPWVKGAAMLYTREFFELAKTRLNPGGVVTLFVQLYESNTEAVKSEVATFFEAFPNGMIFANTYNGAGLRPRAARPGRRHDDQSGRDGGAAQAARVRTGGEVARATSACTRRSICSPPTAGRPRT